MLWGVEGLVFEEAWQIVKSEQAHDMRFKHGLSEEAL